MSRNINDKIKKLILQRQDNKCANKKGSDLIGLKDVVCPVWDSNTYKGDISNNYEIDHIKEFCISHDDSPENLQALCPCCHSVKTKQFNQKCKEIYDNDKGIVKKYYDECPNRTNPDLLYDYLCDHVNEKMPKRKFLKVLKDIRLDIACDFEKFNKYLKKYNYKYYNVCFNTYVEDMEKKYNKGTEIYNLPIDKYMELWIKNNYMDVIKEAMRLGMLPVSTIFLG